jgi:class 3 adenylate cyclase
MKDFSLLSDGQKTELLICFTDVTAFTSLVKSEGSENTVQILRDLATLMDERLGKTPGKIIKYIGDASLIVFPDECVDEGVRALLELKNGCDEYFVGRELPNRLTVALHYGEVFIVRLPPIQGIDVVGDAVNTTAMLEHGRSKGRFVISPQVFRKLESGTRKRFHKFTPPIVYYSE